MRIREIAITLVTGCLLLDPESASSAAAPVHAGVEGGVGVGHLSNESEFDQAKLSAGLSLDFGVAQGIAMRSGLYWRPNGSGLSGGTPETISLALRLDYVALPVGATYRLTSISGLQLLAYGAMEAAYLVKARQLEDDMNTGESERDVTDQMQRWDLAPVLGLAVFTTNGFEVALQHSWGLLNVYENNGDLKNRSLWLLGTLWIDFP